MSEMTAKIRRVSKNNAFGNVFLLDLRKWKLEISHLIKSAANFLCKISGNSVEAGNYFLRYTK